jgi:Fe-S-cluster containining protein
VSGYYEFAGEKVVLEHRDGEDVLTFGTEGTGRVCGSCSLCCKLLPIPGPPLHKPANTRCQHQRHGKGCSIYPTRPLPCRAFACRWLADRDTAGMPRPDRAHYVIDIEADYIEMIDTEGGEPRKVGVIQVWVDPAYRDALRSPDLRDYMQRVAVQYGYATIVRYNESDAFVVFAPAISSDRQWHEKAGSIQARTRDEAEILRRYKVGTTDR